MSHSNPDTTQLSSKFTVGDCKAFLSEKNKAKIAELLYSRFSERYIEPVSSPGKHGFTIMAIACLMIEALESFRQGWESSEGKSKTAFCFFFDKSANLSAFRGHAQQFYKHVRCGILHQAETTGGWWIVRKGVLFDADSLTINATKFLANVGKELTCFCSELEVADWDSPEWQRVRKKITAVCQNCGREIPSAD